MTTQHNYDLIVAMNLDFNPTIAENYKSPSQRIRVLTEAWVDEQIFCPNCGSLIKPYQRNHPAGDFYCSECAEDYELKSKNGSFGNKINDGAYKTFLQCVKDERNPNFFLLSYNDYRVINFAVVPKYFFSPQIIEKRKPLSLTARRAGWTGCNILINQIPDAGKVFYIRGGIIQSKKAVLYNWQKTNFLAKTKASAARNWLQDTMLCIDKLGLKEFELTDMYKFEVELSKKHPQNQHIRAKIRQQLQVLRNNGYLVFEGKGKYKLVTN